MVLRRALALAAAATSAGAVLWWAPQFRPGAVVPTATAVGTLAAMATLPSPVRRDLGWLLLPPGVVSLTATGVVLATDTGSDTPATGTLVEVAALLLILIHVTRWNRGPSLPIVAAVTALAQSAWLLRYMPDATWLERLVGCTSWALGSAVAIAFGAYPRWAASRLQRSVSQARTAQQRQLERDLHDYVAHDLSGMIVQAQAARYAAADDPAALIEALRRIEEAGHRAMSSMDRALSLLRAGDGAPACVARHPGLDELATLVQRFERESGVRTELVARGDPVTVPGEVGEVLYRACSEGLTNVRRHAGSELRSVTVTLQVTNLAAALEVSNHLSGPSDDTIPGDGASTRAMGGTGLARLNERVAALDGTLEAGPIQAGWRLAVDIPYTGTRDLDSERTTAAP
ncbi:MAG: sensor histidine kinase [Nocardioidaceae bacterium]